ncbi:MAG: thiamine phosphate synthase [Parabacteroides sp.]|nr:thiamine phosphate synthase [Parabacteroides sp.]
MLLLNRSQYACFEGDDSAPIMFITHPSERYTEEQQVLMAQEGGCTWIQIRMKENLTLEAATKLVRLVEFSNRACIDDDLEIAIKSGAFTVHLGKNDMPVDEAWKIIFQRGYDDLFLVGATANTFEDIVDADRRGASYIGLGPYRFTETKKNLSPILGLEGYERIMGQCREAGLKIPVIAIGGIRYEDIGPLMNTGIAGIAVSSAITQAPDPVKEMKRFCAKLLQYTKKMNIDKINNL